MTKHEKSRSKHGAAFFVFVRNVVSSISFSHGQKMHFAALFDANCREVDEC